MLRLVKEAVSKACHPAPDAVSPRKKDTGFQGIAGQAHSRQAKV
jgi:hypothetical protein